MLKNPPKDKKIEQIYDKKGNIARKSYDEVQSLISERAKDLEDKYIKNREQIAKTVEKKLMKLRKGALRIETELFYELLGKDLGLDPSAYFTLVRNSPANRTKQISNKEPNIFKMTTYEFWTRAAHGLLDISNGQVSRSSDHNFASQDEAEKYALSMVLSSTNLYNFLKSTHDEGIFSRRLALKDSGINIDNSKISVEALEKLSEDTFEKDITDQDLFAMMADTKDNEENLFNPNDITGFGSALTTMLQETMQDSFDTYFDMKGYNKSRKKNKKLSPYFRKSKEKVQARSVSATLRGKIANRIDSFIDDQLSHNKWTKEQAYYFGAHFKYICRNAKGQIYFEAISKRYSQGNAMYDDQREIVAAAYQAAKEGEKKFQDFLKDNKELQRDLVNTLLNTLSKSIGDLLLKEKPQSLFISSIGNFNISNFINHCYVQGHKCFKSKEDFYNVVTSRLLKDKKIYFTSYKYLPHLYQSFKASNSNSYVSGFLGELGALYGANQIFKKMDRMTGGNNVFAGFDEGGTHAKYGESVNDLSYNLKEIERKIGINVKHYATKSDGELTLYPGKTDSGLSIFKTAANKYLGTEDANIARFVLENSSYFNDDIEKMGAIVERIASYHVPEFYRAFDNARYTLVNIFYVINNVYYPLSYIYTCALDQLREITSDLSNLLEVTTERVGGGSEPYYDNLLEAREKWRQDDWRLGPHRKGYYDAYIKTTGLKINLMQLNLL